MPPAHPAPEPWHLDKRVPVALILALFVQTVGAIWWASSITSDVADLQIRQTRQEALTDTIRTTANGQAVQLGRIEEITLGIQRSVEALSRQGVRP